MEILGRLVALISMKAICFQSEGPVQRIEMADPEQKRETVWGVNRGVEFHSLQIVLAWPAVCCTAFLFYPDALHWASRLESRREHFHQQAWQSATSGEQEQPFNLCTSTMLLMVTIWYLFLSCLYEASWEYAFMNNQGVTCSFSPMKTDILICTLLPFSRQSVATCHHRNFQKWAELHCTAVQLLSRKSKDVFEQFCVSPKAKALILRSG